MRVFSLKQENWFETRINFCIDASDEMCQIVSVEEYEVRTERFSIISIYKIPLFRCAFLVVVYFFFVHFVHLPIFIQLRFCFDARTLNVRRCAHQPFGCDQTSFCEQRQPSL